MMLLGRNYIMLPYYVIHSMSLDMRKSVFGICDQVRPKQAYSATETRLIIETLHEAGLDIIFPSEGITDVLIRLRGCPGHTVIKLFPCSTQVSTKFKLLIKTKIRTSKEVSYFKSLRYCIYHANKC